MEDSKTEERKNFMKPSYQDPLKKREEFAVSLRKKKTHDIINAKRRRLYGQFQEETQGGEQVIGGTYKGYAEFEKNPDKFNEILEQLCPDINNRTFSFVCSNQVDQLQEQRIQYTLNQLVSHNNLDIKDQLVLLTSIRKAISGHEDPPVTEILETNILSVIAQIFRFPDNIEENRIMKLEAIWILTNLAYGTKEDILKIFDPTLDLFGCMNNILMGNDRPMIEQILWLVGNITGECESFRDLILKNTSVLQACKNLVDGQKIQKSLLKTICWVTSNLNRYKHLDRNSVRIANDFNHLQIALSFQIAKVGLFTEDNEIISDCLWTLSYLADTTDDQLLDMIGQAEVLTQLVNYLGDKDLSVFVPALRAIGNILTTNDPAIVQRALWIGVIDKLTNVLYQSNSNIIKECLWAFSNISAGTAEQAKAILESPAIERIMYLAESKNIDNRKEAMWVVANCLTVVDIHVRNQVFVATEGRILEQLVRNSMACQQDKKLIMNILEAIQYILDLDEYNGTKGTDQAVTLLFERQGGLDALEELQKNPNYEVYDRANQILSKYFESDNQMDMGGNRGNAGSGQTQGGGMFNI